MSFEQVSPAYYDVGHLINQQNNRNSQMKMCVERRASTNAIIDGSNGNYIAATLTSAQMYWNGDPNDALNSPQHRRLDRSQSEPCNTSKIATNVNSSRYKTELCRPFEEKGYCKYGDKCQFAHGENELKTIMRHPKYKTDLCHKYHTDGFCGYGTRCNFIHNETGIQLNRIATNNRQAYVSSYRKQESLALPGPIQRPSSIKFNPSAVVRPMSSLSDSSSSTPPSSTTDSPSLSPTFFGGVDDIFSAARCQDYPAPLRHNSASPPLALNNVAITDNVSQLAEITNLLAPLYVQTHLSLTGELPSNLNTLLHHRHSDDSLFDTHDLASELSGIIAAPHSPPESISGDSLASSSSSSGSSSDFTACPSPVTVSPSEVSSSTGLRLPVFAQFSHTMTAVPAIF